MSVKKTDHLVKFDSSRKKTKLFCIYETYFCENDDAHLETLASGLRGKVA